MLAESNRPSVSPELPTQNPVLGADSSYRAKATATDRVLQVLQRRKWAIATAALAAASGIWAWTLTRPYIYEGQVQVLADDAEFTTGSNGLEPALIESAAVLEPAVDSLQAEYPGMTYERLSENLSVTTQQSGTLAVRYLGSSPAEVEAVLRQVAQQYQDVSREPVTFTLPTVGDRPISPKILKGLLLGAIAGLSLGAAAGLLTEKLDRSFHSPDSLKTFTKLPMLGIIPFFKTLQPIKPGRLAPPQTPLLTGLGDYETASFSEAFRSLYSNLRFLKTDRPVRSLVISSAIPAEGKSTTALNLAKAAAVMGQRVLLVDADLRLPQIHARLQLPNRTGLSEILAQRLSWRSHVRTALDENLQILTAGNPPADPVRLLSSSAMRELMHELSEAYDLVIYDMPPLLGFTDSGLVASQTDGMVLVVGLGTTTRMELKQTLDSLEVMPVQVLGMVANGIRSHTTQSYSYDRYHRYYAQRAIVSAAESDLGLTSATAIPGVAPSTETRDHPAEPILEEAIAAESVARPSLGAPAKDLDAAVLDEPESLDSVDLDPMDLNEVDSLELADEEETDLSLAPTAGTVDSDIEADPLAVPNSAELTTELKPDVELLPTPSALTTEATLETEPVEDDIPEETAASATPPEVAEPEPRDVTASLEADQPAEEQAEPQPTLFSQMMSEMKALVQVYSGLPRLLQQVNQANQDTAEEASGHRDSDQTDAVGAEYPEPNGLDDDALSDRPPAASVEDQSFDSIDNNILDEEPVGTLDIDELTDPAVDSLEHSAPPALTLEDEDLGDRVFDPLDEAPGGTADLEPEAAELSSQAFMQNGFDADRETPPAVNITADDGSIEYLESDSLAWLDAEPDDADDDLLDEPLSDDWPDLDAFLDDDDAPDAEPHATEEVSGPELTMSDADIRHEQAESTEVQDDEAGDRPFVDTGAMDATDPLGSASVELSDDELAHLQAQGLLSSLALPDESVLEDSEANASGTEPSPSPAIDPLFNDVDDRMAEEDTLILIPEANGVAGLFPEHLEAGPTADAPTELPTDQASETALPQQNGRSPYGNASQPVPYEEPEDVLIDSLRHLKDEDWDMEDDFPGDHVTELEEQELKELLSWDTVELNQTVSNQFERAVLAAQDAIRIGETVTTPEEWLLLSTHWQQAAELMATVSADDPNFEIAQRCSTLYQNNSEYAYQKARQEAGLDS